MVLYAGSRTRTVKIQEEVKRLTGIVIDVLEANGFGVIATFSRDYICKTLKCGSFDIEVYLYPHLADELPHIWITRNLNEPDDLNPLIKQLKLVGFDVDIVIDNSR